MVHQVKHATAKPAKPVQYTPMNIKASDGRSIEISFIKGTEVIIDGKAHTVGKEKELAVDAKHYEALLKADATKDGKIDAADTKAIMAKMAYLDKTNETRIKAHKKELQGDGLTAFPFGINCQVDKTNWRKGTVGIGFPGFIQYTNSHPEG